MLEKGKFIDVRSSTTKFYNKCKTELEAIAVKIKNSVKNTQRHINRATGAENPDGGHGVGGLLDNCQVPRRVLQALGS